MQAAAQVAAAVLHAVQNIYGALLLAIQLLLQYRYVREEVRLYRGSLPKYLHVGTY